MERLRLKAERSLNGFALPGFGSVRKNGERFDVDALELLINTKPSIEADPCCSEFSHEQVDAAVVNVGKPLSQNRQHGYRGDRRRVTEHERLPSNYQT
jgi:hypothetical protein